MLAYNTQQHTFIFTFHSRIHSRFSCSSLTIGKNGAIVSKCQYVSLVYLVTVVEVLTSTHPNSISCKMGDTTSSYMCCCVASWPKTRSKVYVLFVVFSVISWVFETASTTTGILSAISFRVLPLEGSHNEYRAITTFQCSIGHGVSYLQRTTTCIFVPLSSFSARGGFPYRLFNWLGRALCNGKLSDRAALEPLSSRDNACSFHIGKGAVWRKVESRLKVQE